MEEFFFFSGCRFEFNLFLGGRGCCCFVFFNLQVEFKLEIFSYYNIIQISPQSSLVGLEPEEVMNNSTKELVL